MNQPNEFSSDDLDDQPTKLTSPWFDIEYITNGIALLVSALFVGYLLSNEWSYSGFYAWIPAFAVVLFTLRWRILSVLLPLALFASIGFLGYTTGTRLLDSSNRLLLVAASLLTLVFTMRFSRLIGTKASAIVSKRMNYTPIDADATSTEATRIVPGHFLTLPMLLFAWWFGSYLSSQLTLFLANTRTYNAAYRMLDQRIGLYPEWYVGIKVLFALVLLLFFFRQLFGYLALRQSKTVALMHLRSELWRWDGAEQRMVGKHLNRISPEDVR